jgi:tetratricopeptide (TPR) repeat protein
LRGLSSEKAEMVGGRLLMAGQLIDSDPELANRHALAAKQSAPRLPIVREAVGETAYAMGDFAAALNEFRALRRMSGTDEYLPAMADCERALGRKQAALKLVKEGLARSPEVPELVELRLVEAGIRAESGQIAEALRLLQSEIENVATRGPKIVRARLRYAYADLLEQSGQLEAAEQWFGAADRLDVEQTTDAVDRVARLRGVVIEFDEDDYFGDEEAADFGDGDSPEAADHPDIEAADPSELVGFADGEPVTEENIELASAQDVTDSFDLGAAEADSTTRDGEAE